jgi:hypothetical protein
MVKKKSLLEDPIFQTLVAAIAATMARLANLKGAGFYAEAQSEIDKRLDELLGLKSDQLKQLSDEFILDILTVNEILDLQRLWYVAELIDSLGEIQAAQGRKSECLDSRSRALDFLIEVAFSSSEPIPEVNQRIDAIVKDLWVNLSEETLFSLFSYYEKHGDHPSALLAIDQLLVITHNHPDLVMERDAYIQRLSQDAERAP